MFVRVNLCVFYDYFRTFLGSVYGSFTTILTVFISTYLLQICAGKCKIEHSNIIGNGSSRNTIFSGRTSEIFIVFPVSIIELIPYSKSTRTILLVSSNIRSIESIEILRTITSPFATLRRENKIQNSRIYSIGNNLCTHPVTLYFIG